MGQSVIRYLVGLSEEVPALPVILDLTRKYDPADRAVSSCQPRVCGENMENVAWECDLGLDAKYCKSIIVSWSTPLLDVSSIERGQ